VLLRNNGYLVNSTSCFSK